MVRKYHVGGKAPLSEKDNEKQTFGCRCYNPDICKNQGLPSCAFNNDEHICYMPPKTWKKVYEELKKKVSE